MAMNRVEKKRKTATALTLRISGVLLLVFVVMISFIIGLNKTDLTTRELDKLEMLADENATIAVDFMETMLNKQAVIIAAVEGTGKLPNEDRAEFMKNLLTEVKAQQKDVLSVFYVAEPNALFPNTPNGFSVFSTEQGTVATADQFTNINKAAYEKARAGKNMTIVDPFQKEIDGKKYMALTVLQPILDDAGKVVGMVGSNIDAAVLNTAAYNDGGFESFTNQIICGHKTFIINSADPTVIGKPFIDATTSTNGELILDSAETEDALTFLDTDKSGNQNYRVFVPFHVGTSKVVWLSGTSISKAEFDDQIVAQIILMGGIAAVGFLLLVLFCYFTIRKTLRPIAELESAARRMAEGDLSTLVSHRSNDDLGRLGDSFNQSSTSLSFYISEIDRVMDEMSAGNFDLKFAKPFIGDFAGIERSLNKFTTKICDTLSRINLVSTDVAGASDLVSTGSSALNQGSGEQASAIEQLSATITEISVQVRKNAENAHDASGNAAMAGQQLEQSDGQMKEMIVAMREISETSGEISRIIKTIEDIAFQTNILALNAAVEAARAGAAGKGFAVVADEVRNLAGKSAEAAKSTTEMIGNSVKAVEGGVKIATEAADSFGSVLVRAHAVVDNMDMISRACSEQAEAIGQVTQGAAQISSVTQANSATAEESAAASEELSRQAQLLQSLVARFHLKDEAAGASGFTTAAATGATGSTGGARKPQTMQQAPQEPQEAYGAGKY